ncbi:transmembrane protein, partial [Gorgonomyces haynaldii]
MLQTHDTLIPARFLLLTSHFIASVMVYQTRDANVRLSAPLNADPTPFDNSIKTAVALSWMAFMVEYFGLFYGKTLFRPMHNLIYVLCHAAGTVAACLHVMATWNVAAYWYIFIFCSLIPCFVEGASLSPLV